MKILRKPAGRLLLSLILAVLLIAALCLAGCETSAGRTEEDPGVTVKQDSTEIPATTVTEPEPTEAPVIHSAESEAGEDLDADDGWFVCDLNGDGVPEEFSLDHIGNGDEAADYGIITRQDDGSEAYIDRFYGIDKIIADEDAAGRYLEISYYTGDFYEHSSVAKCILRDKDGELDIRRVSGKEAGAFFDFMDDYMSQKLNNEFNGEYLPVSVTDAAAGEPEYEITDTETINAIYEALKKVHIGEQADDVITDGDRRLTFRFKNGDSKIYLFYGEGQIYFEEFVYEITDDGGLFKVLEEADRLDSTTRSAEGTGGSS